MSKREQAIDARAQSPFREHLRRHLRGGACARGSARAEELLEWLSNLDDPPSRSREARRTLVAILAGVVLVATVGTAIAAKLVTQEDIERFLPQGSVVFVGADPHCTAQADPSVYRCKLARTPTTMTVGEPGRPQWRNAKFGTVDDEGRVNGGCVALNSAGTDWWCYLGEQAVDEGILDEGVLGTEQSGPSHGCSGQSSPSQ